MVGTGVDLKGWQNWRWDPGRTGNCWGSLAPKWSLQASFFPSMRTSIQWDRPWVVWVDLVWVVRNNDKYIYIYIPGTYLSSIFGLQPSKTRPFPIKTRVIWVPGIYIYILHRICFLAVGCWTMIQALESSRLFSCWRIVEWATIYWGELWLLRISQLLLLNLD